MTIAGLFLGMASVLGSAHASRMRQPLHSILVAATSGRLVSSCDCRVRPSLQSGGPIDFQSR